MTHDIQMKHEAEEFARDFTKTDLYRIIAQGKVEEVQYVIAGLEECLKREKSPVAALLFKERIEVRKKELSSWKLKALSLVQKSTLRITEERVEDAKRFPCELVLKNRNYRTTGGKKITICPFHRENTPSFTIFPDNHWYCFGCHERGDVISLYMRTHDTSFIDAVEALSQL